MARGKSNHTMFHKIMGNLEKNAGHRYWSSFFLTCDRKTLFFPHGPCCIWFPFSDSYGTEVHKNDDIYPWLKCTIHSSACKFNDFVMNNPDNCSFNHFFFFQYTFTNCSSLSCHSRLHSIPCYRYLELYCDFLIPARRDDLDPGRGEFPVHC